MVQSVILNKKIKIKECLCYTLTIISWLLGNENNENVPLKIRFCLDILDMEKAETIKICMTVVNDFSCYFVFISRQQKYFVFYSLAYMSSKIFSNKNEIERNIRFYYFVLFYCFLHSFFGNKIWSVNQIP